MTKQEFKSLWESDADDCGITLNDAAECAKEWGISNSPKTESMNSILYRVLVAANVSDSDAYKPEVQP
jgi:hypothetical protein